MKKFALLTLFGVVLVGCGESSGSDKLTPNQEVGAKMLGIGTPEGVQHDAGPYTPDVNFAKSIVGTQQKREARESATVNGMLGSPH